MALSGAVRVEVSSEQVFPRGAQCMGVEAELDFEARSRGDADDQKRDKETGERVWVVRVVDLDPAATKFGGSTEAKVKIVAEHQPVPPAAQVPGYPPLVDFEGLTLTPYVNGQPCNAKRDKHAPCKARQAFSLRATGMRPGRPVEQAPAEVDKETGEVPAARRRPGQAA